MQFPARKKNKERESRKQSSTVITPYAEEQVQWDHLIESTFDRPVKKAPAVREEKPAPKRRNWLWAVLAAVVVIGIATVCILPSVFGSGSADTSIPAELIPCKEALDQWQTLDSCKITLHLQRYNNSKSSSSWYQECWISGEDWILFNNASQTSTNYPNGYMYRGGEMFLTYDLGGMWAPYETEEPAELELWPMEFSWENCELVHRETTASATSGTTILFSVVDKDPEQMYFGTSPYYVQFQLSITGRLQSVTVVQVRSDLTVAMDTYMLSSSDADEVSQYIEKQDTSAKVIVDIE